MPPIVLVVDDDDVIRQLIRVNLELEGFAVRTAADGMDCLEIAASLQPVLITLDVMMPRLDGYRTAEQLSADPVTRDIPILMLSARAQEEDRRRGAAAGVREYLTKPFDPADLLAAVRRLVGPNGGID